ncbi:BrnA antitoxin family protein [Brevundimonas aurifodinae]|uniref:BrnA antitoxin family protein n=2 Tax=Brevundimonas TaxID=41275 RepID=A0ABV1NQG3_9CAUL|nr:MAG: hypothetical protein B7Z42_15205 [Brevundimonas sp. 12-68-7]OYX32108.1 MAG: hypothetical protein B7Z01_11640 [Brevundimonas subvibrioides]
MSFLKNKPDVFDDDFEPDLTDPDNPEWTEEDFARALRPHEFPEWIFEAFPNTPRPVRGTQKGPTKTPISLRVDTDILERYRATGPGWQSRMNDALRKAMPG